MKILKYIIIINLIGIIAAFIIVFITNNAFYDSFNFQKLEPAKLIEEDTTSKKIKVINFEQIEYFYKKNEGYKHVYFFSYYCSACRKSIKKGSYKLSELNKKVIELPTILISCDNYGTIDKLETLIDSNQNVRIFILDNKVFKSKSKINTFERLELFLEKHYKGKYDKSIIGYPYNIILDSNNNIVNTYPGSIL